MARSDRVVADIEVSVDTHAVRLALKRLDPEVEKQIRDVVKKDTIKVRNLVREYAPQQTGLLAATIKSRTQFNQKRTGGTVFVQGPARKYAWIVEHGTKGESAFEGRKYISRAEKAVVPSFKARLQKATDEAIATVGLKDY
ncbi:MAG: HK97 gp10 family phage protein [Caulobacteraceae bacterium]|nr:HK97 gp10 family phage protein [Caulobacteraceae bacterium]